MSRAYTPQPGYVPWLDRLNAWWTVRKHRSEIEEFADLCCRLEES